MKIEVEVKVSDQIHPGKTVFKFRLKEAPIQLVEMPAGSRIEYAGMDINENLCVWAQCNPEAATAAQVIECVNTGDKSSRGVGARTFLGTVTFHGISIVHVFLVHQVSVELYERLLLEAGTL